MTSIVIVAALLERLQVLFPEGNPNRELITKVTPVREQLKQIIDHADADYEAADEIAKSFKGKIVELSYEFVDLIESYELEVKSRRNQFLQKIIRRCSPRRKVIKECCEKLSSLIIQAYKSFDNYRPQNLPVSHARGFLASASFENPSEIIVGMQQLEREVSAELLSDNLQLTHCFILGMGGIGKTTLAKRLFQNQDIRYHFTVRAWVCVSQGYQTRRILLEILSSISGTWNHGRHHTDMSEEEMAEMIYRSLKGKRYLIVLDDV